MEAKHTPGRIDRAIAACEQVDSNARNGRYSTWADFCHARTLADQEYEAASTEMVIRATRAAIAQATGGAP